MKVDPVIQEIKAIDAEQVAESFHDAYESLAADFNYETRKETRRFDPESPNGKLMIATVTTLIDAGVIGYA